MILEEYIDKGILLTELLNASKRTPIILDNGEIQVSGLTFGTKGCDYTLDVLRVAVEHAYLIVASKED